MAQTEDEPTTVDSDADESAVDEPVVEEPVVEEPVVDEPLNLSPVDALLIQINAERRNAGLEPVVMQPQLMQAAQAHADDMAQGDFGGHRGSDDSTTETRVRRAGYFSQPIAENVAIGSDDAEAIVQKWRGNAFYSLNLLAPNQQAVGIGYAQNPDRASSHYWTLVLGSTPLSTPEMLLEQVNQARQNACVPALSLDNTLTTLAQTEAETSAAATAEGDRHAAMKETLAAQEYAVVNHALFTTVGQSTPSAASGQWQQQSLQSERPSLVSPKYQQAGFGVAAPGNQPHWTVLLTGTKPSAIAIPESEPFFREQGRLEPGVDDVLPEDGSTYDLYSFDASAGQTITMTLESTEFDPYLFLFNATDIQIASNDDISESDYNSRLQVTLPCDGTYRVIVNSYEPDSQGQYDLVIYKQE